jgi:N-acetylglutamate synthase-like GNAT family acetyltransferase
MDDDVIVFEVDGKIAGYAILMLGQERALLDNIAADPDAQRQGIGLALIGDVEDKARRPGHAALDLLMSS